MFSCNMSVFHIFFTVQGLKAKECLRHLRGVAICDSIEGLRMQSQFLVLLAQLVFYGSIVSRIV